MAQNFNTTASQMRANGKFLVSLGSELVELGNQQLAAAEKVETLNTRVQSLFPSAVNAAVPSNGSGEVGITRYPRRPLTVKDAAEAVLRRHAGKLHKDALFEEIVKSGATVSSVASMMEIMRTDKDERFVHLGKGVWAIRQMNLSVESETA